MDVLATGEIEVGAAELWAIVKDFGAVGWMQGVSKVEVEGDGVGMIRYIHAAGGAPIPEKLTSLDEGARRLEYTILENNPLPVSNYAAHVSVVDLGDGRSRLEWGCSADPQGDVDEATAKAGVEGMYGVMIGWVKAAAEA